MTKIKFIIFILAVIIMSIIAFDYYENSMTSCCTKDPELALNAKAQYALAMNYLNSVDGVQSVDKAITLFQKSARQGNGDAIVQLNFLDVEY